MNCTVHILISLQDVSPSHRPLMTEAPFSSIPQSSTSRVLNTELVLASVSSFTTDYSQQPKQRHGDWRQVVLLGLKNK